MSWVIIILIIWVLFLTRGLQDLEERFNDEHEDDVWG